GVCSGPRAALMAGGGMATSEIGICDRTAPCGAGAGKGRCRTWPVRPICPSRWNKVPRGCDVGRIDRSTAPPQPLFG
ncbi:MAG: hypothetical protein ACK56I_13955, partial [bacterium]